MSSEPESKHESIAFIYGFLGVSIFSLTLPATHIAVAELDPIFVGLGRAIIAAVPSLILLLLTRQTFPAWRFLPRFGIVIAGVIIGFPLLSALAMKDAPASYGAVITGLLPLSTAICGVWQAKERPSRQFWLFAMIGSSLTIIFALLSGSGSLRFADLALFGAAAAAGLGYAEGAVLARFFGSWQVICWSLVFSVPILLPIVLQYSPPSFVAISPKALYGFFYVSTFSMFLGFFAWYRGLFSGGIARIGQIQLIQPFLTIFASTAFFGEKLTIETLAFAFGVILCVALGKRAQIRTVRSS